MRQVVPTPPARNPLPERPGASSAVASSGGRGRGERPPRLGGVRGGEGQELPPDAVEVKRPAGGMFATSPGESTRVRWVETVRPRLTVTGSMCSPDGGAGGGDDSAVVLAEHRRDGLERAGVGDPGEDQLGPEQGEEPVGLRAPPLPGLGEVLQRGEQQESLAAAF